jgi:hypothetical protein
MARGEIIETAPRRDRAKSRAPDATGWAIIIFFGVTMKRKRRCYGLFPLQPLMNQRAIHPIPEQQTIKFAALRDIVVGEDITVNYNGDPGSRKPVWFAAV